jgi:hypothetical protein
MGDQGGRLVGASRPKEVRQMQAAGSRCRVLTNCQLRPGVAVKHEPRDFVLCRGTLLWKICVRRVLVVIFALV